MTRSGRRGALSCSVQRSEQRSGETCAATTPRHRRTRSPGRLARLAGALLLAVWLGTPNLAGQMMVPGSGEPSGDSEITGVDFFALVGVLQPLGNLTDNPNTYGTTIPPDVLAGGELTIWLSKAFGVGFMGLYAPASLGRTGVRFGQGSANLGDLSYMAGAVNLTVRIMGAGSAGALEPYLSIGGGVRRLGFSGPSVPKIDSMDPLGTIAGGVRIALSSKLWLRGEVRDIISMYDLNGTADSRLQNDIGITIGFGIR